MILKSSKLIIIKNKTNTLTSFNIMQFWKTKKPTVNKQQLKLMLFCPEKNKVCFQPNENRYFMWRRVENA